MYKRNREKLVPVKGEPRTYTYYLLDENWVVNFLNHYLNFLRRKGYEPDAGIIAEVPTPEGTKEIEFKEIK
ncbi:MAG: hypothetical protein DRJ44_08140 [Thermoprotei archaeon]|nr:MAG: hypothetical protein DRJ44_08140 [Thermoprotei archaeon]